jgi:hypothetical protein
MTRLKRMGWVEERGEKHIIYGEALKERDHLEEDLGVGGRIIRKYT